VPGLPAEDGAAADEPTGELDSESGQAVVGLLEELNREGPTVVIVTHNPQVAAAARREVTLRDGKITSDVRRVEARA